MTDLTALFTDLVRLETRLYNVLDARLKAEHDLPLGQFEFLRVIESRGTARVYDLAHQMAITVGATSKAVDRLEAAGRCRRTANPNDRRSSLVALTPEGERVLAAAAPTVEAELRHWVGSVLPAANLEQPRDHALDAPPTGRVRSPHRPHRVDGDHTAGSRAKDTGQPPDVTQPGSLPWWSVGVRLRVRDAQLMWYGSPYTCQSSGVFRSRLPLRRNTRCAVSTRLVSLCASSCFIAQTRASRKALR